MKKLFKGVLVAGCVILTAGFAKAQTKIGYVNFQQLITTAPEIKGIQAQIEAYQKTFTDVLQGMQAELQKNAADYDAKRTTMTDALRSKTEGELQDLQKRIQEQTQDAQNKVEQKQNEYLKPLVDKLKAAIAQVAKEKGYTYIINNAQDVLVIMPEGDDITAAVKARTGAPAAAPAASVRK